ncbi:MAG TPA: hypothetical protein VEZ20_08870 [Allosphingosinicella sp.]|nr:hypothetical protein [Allosphingosinicella sp.]
MKRLLALIPALVLAGCFTGGPFYTASDSRPPFPDGRYRMAGTAATGGSLAALTRRPDGMVEVRHIGSDDPPSRAGFVPLDPQGRRFAVWAEPQGRAASLLSSGYGLLERRPDGGWTLHAVHCDGIENLAAAAGAEVTRGELGSFCEFPNRESLERALRRIDLSAEPFRSAGVRLEPVSAP